MARIGRGVKWAMLAGAVGLAAAVAADAPRPAPTFLEAGYLDLLPVVPPAPIPEEARGIADREIFRLTRALRGTPRWAMAIADNDSDTPSLMRAFSCAAGVSMTPATAPKTAALLEKASRDTRRETNEIKSFYKKRRPFLIDEGEICIARTPDLAASYDYPSGHATRGWTWGLVLAEILHERAAPLLARGRAYGESRIVCGVHNMSAIEAGRMVAGSTLAVVRTERDYVDAVAEARAELLALRNAGSVPSAQACSIEEAIVSQPLYR